VALLETTQLEDFLSEHDGWEMAGDSLVRTFSFEDFNEALSFVVAVGLKAERAFHHPDIDIRWNRVTLRLSTHSEGGITEKDTELAVAVESLV